MQQSWTENLSTHFATEYGGRLKEAVSNFSRLAAESNCGHTVNEHCVVAAVHSLCAEVAEAEGEGLSRDEILRILEPARYIHAGSPFIRRLQRWPRGYPGDFETIEYICEGRNRATAGTIAHVLESYALTCAAAQQHRNKVTWQAWRVLDACYRSNGTARILSVGCGGSRDLLCILPFVSRHRPAIWLNDIDPDALALSANRLESVNPTVIAGDAFRATRAFRAAGPFDLITAGGLFDYLSDKQIVWILGRLLTCLRPGGRLCFTNIARGNPYRLWIEYLANWQIAERSEAEVLRLVSGDGEYDDIAPVVSRDPSGLTLLVELAKGR